MNGPFFGRIPAFTIPAGQGRRRGPSAGAVGGGLLLEDPFQQAPGHVERKGGKAELERAFGHSVGDDHSDQDADG